ncbi:MAG TPA: thiamine-phosphate kinase [Verrucomicrobiae bacterium]|nr:thiamine-phosphate kinase [Verrucomicrobiae bacterium]
MDEFELIKRYFAELTAPRADVKLGIGDDAALLAPPRGHEVVVTTDTLIAGRHFPEDTDPQAVGWKALAVNLSDLAAMGAEPRWFTLALTLRMPDPEWLSGFASGLGAMAREAGVALVGGDTSQGALSITITAMGTVPAGKAIRRSGAKVGDAVCVTGTLGDAALGLRLLGDTGGKGESHSADLEHLRSRLHRPVPRVAVGASLRGLAHAAIDLSDGLAGDLSHILSASGVGAELRMASLPMSPAFKTLSEPEVRAELQVAGGDDYELCICLPPANVAKLRAKLDVPLTEVGRVVKGKALTMLDAKGKKLALDPFGYRHFA